MSVVVSLDGSPVSPATNIICSSSGISTMRLKPSAISTFGGGIDVSFNNDMVLLDGHLRSNSRWLLRRRIEVLRESDDIG